MTEPRPTEADTVAAITQASSEPKPLDPVSPQALIIPAGGHAHIPDLDKYLPTPRRKTGTYKPADVTSLIDYLTVHSDTEHTTIWIDQVTSRIVAVINDNAAGAPGWRDHRADLQLLTTPEWKHWTSRDGQRLGQEDFAEHLQDGVEQIRVPDAATMLEIAQTIQGKTKVDWRSATRLDNGEIGFAYQEEVQASAGRAGQLEIPQELTLAVSPFYGEPPSDLTARLRYRIRDGNLTIGYKLNQPHELVLGVLKRIAGRLLAGFEHVYMGTAP